MIDPTSITKHDRSIAELQAFWIFSIVVAGKNSDWAARVVGRLLGKTDNLNPFDYLRGLGEGGLHNTLVANKVGQYARITRAITQSLDLDLENCSVADLEGVHGVGPKTARFFLLHTRADQHLAVLDTHILKWLASRGVSVPKNTPQSGAKYKELERMFLDLSRFAYPHLDPAARDLLIWTEMSGRSADSIV